MTERRTFYGVQVLRGAAALLVVGFHLASTLASGSSSGGAGGGFHSVPNLYFGNSGVDLFFLISGFVIVWTTQDSWARPFAWRSFLEKRMTRIFPLYWVLTSAKIVLVLALPFLFRGTHLLPWNTLASYLLIPSLDGEGRVNPVITAGWTLCFEMTFYYVCAACLAMRRQPILIATPLFVLLGLLGIFRTPGWIAIASLADPILLEFVAGMWIAELTRRCLVRGHPLAMLALLITGIALLLATNWLPPATALAFRALVWGGPAAMILLATVALETRFDFRRLWLPLLLGDASYSIYLIHVLVLPPLATRARVMAFSPAGEWFVFLALGAFAFACGLIVWWLVERKFVGRLLQVSRPMRQAWVNPEGRQLVVRDG